MQQISPLSSTLFPVAPNGTQKISLDIDVINPTARSGQNTCNTGLTTISPFSSNQTVTSTGIPDVTKSLIRLK